MQTILVDVCMEEELTAIATENRIKNVKMEEVREREPVEWHPLAVTSLTPSPALKTDYPSQTASRNKAM